MEDEKLFLIRRRRSKAVANGVLFAGRGGNRCANKTSEIYAVCTPDEAAAAPLLESQTVKSLFELKNIKNEVFHRLACSKEVLSSPQSSEPQEIEFFNLKTSQRAQSTEGF